MNKAITTSIDRIVRYTENIRNALRRKDAISGMAHTAELGEISRRLYLEFEKIANNKPKGED